MPSHGPSHEPNHEPNHGQGHEHRLAELPAGCSATVLGIAESAEPRIARRLVDLGLTPGTTVTAVRRAPLRDPTLYRFGGTSLCLRAAQAQHVTVHVG